MNKNLLKLYPEISAGNYSRSDGTVEFYQRVNALINESMVVLDYGSGRGGQLLDRSSPYRTELATLQGKVKTLIGVDVDSAVLDNPFMDEKFLIEANAPLPFEDESFDLIYSDWVLEHVADPASFSKEVYRLLKPGGWFCARTPNHYGVVGLAADFLPNKYHKMILKILQPDREEFDVFPTTYKINTIAKVRKYFPQESWENFSYITNPEPPYVQRSMLAMRLMLLYWRLTPEFLHTVMNIFLRKTAPE